MSLHSEKHFMNSLSLRDIIIGMSDGLTVPFALAAGLSGAQIANSVVITAGTAELVAGAIAMGLGGYLAGKSDFEHYQSELTRETNEIKTIPEEEKKEVRSILKKFGISAKTQDQFVDELANDQNNWISFMMEFELGLQKPNEQQAIWSALRIAGAYAIGGVIPLSAYFFTQTSHEGLIASSILTFFALAIFGFIKGKFLNQHPVKSMSRTVLIGALAASAAFFVARLIST
ncbi:iron transporter [Bdellovibrio sp. qaytius]|nr:iron transporter [Bdellovibrio sp. qaytius]